MKKAIRRVIDTPAINGNIQQQQPVILKAKIKGSHIRYYCKCVKISILISIKRIYIMHKNICIRH